MLEAEMEGHLVYAKHDYENSRNGRSTKTMKSNSGLDEMMFYSEDENGNPELCFTYIDLVIDFLLSINLKPFMELSFMPKELADNPTRTMFFIGSVISLPKSMETWTYIIQQLIKHFISRYGKKEVESWPFFLWNEPDVTKMFGFENRDDFFNFYKETYMAIKKLIPILVWEVLQFFLIP